MDFIHIKGLKAHTIPQKRIFDEYAEFRQGLWPERFDLEPDIYDKYPDTEYLYMLDDSGKFLAAARMMVRRPGCENQLSFELKSPYSFNSADGKPGIADHLEHGTVTYAELSGLVVRPELRNSPKGIGGKFQLEALKMLKELPEAPDILVIRALDTNVRLISKAATRTGFDVIVRTDRISQNKAGHNITTILATSKKIELATPNMLEDGTAMKGDMYAARLRGDGRSRSGSTQS